MASSLTPDPLTYAFPGALRNYQYGPELHHTVNYYPNATRITGGNPWILRIHGGGWGFGDKTGTTEGVSIQHITAAYFLDSVNYGTSAAFDVFSMEYNCNAHTGTVLSAYEDTLEGTATGTGPISFPAYARSWINDVQRCVQWIKEHISGISPHKCLLWGESAGAVMAITAAYGPQREFSSVPRGLWTAKYPSNVLGVIAFYPPIDMNPWESNFLEVNGHLGLLTTSNALSRADFERALLIPDSAGLYPSTVESNQLCKSFSPVDVIANRSVETADVRLFTMYRTFDTTTVPVDTYSTIPPRNAHDYTQQADLEAVCDAADISHTDTLVLGPTQINFEACLAPLYAWAADTIG